MEKDVSLPLGADLDLKLDAGKASATLSLPLTALLDKLEAAVEAKSPAPLQPFEKAAFATVKSIVAGL